MREARKLKKLLIALAAGFCLSSLSVLLLPLASFDPERGSVALAYTVGALFWLGLILGYGTFFAAGRRIARRETRRPTCARKALSARPGFFRLASNGHALAADIALGASLAVNAAALLRLFTLPETAQYAMIALLLLSIHFHGLFNGRYFRYVTESVASRPREGRAENAEA